jgi:hypothetical protein
MSSATERKIMRWIHILLSIPIIGYIYGPVAERPEAVVAVRFVFVPIVLVSGLWMWKGYLIKKHFRKRQTSRSLQ